MRALRDLRELVRIAEQNDVAGRRSDGDRVCERDLAGLVEEQRVQMSVEVLAREQERGAGEQLELLVEHRLVRVRAVDELVLVASVRIAARLLAALEREALLERGVAHIYEELVDRPVAQRCDAAPLSAAHAPDSRAG